MVFRALIVWPLFAVAACGEPVRPPATGSESQRADPEVGRGSDARLTSGPGDGVTMFRPSLESAGDETRRAEYWRLLRKKFWRWRGVLDRSCGSLPYHEIEAAAADAYEAVVESAVAASKGAKTRAEQRAFEEEQYQSLAVRLENLVDLSELSPRCRLALLGRDRSVR